MTRFSVKYIPTALFSLKDSNSTNSGAKSLFLPSPYSIKMAILNQAITCDGLDQFNSGDTEELKKKKTRKEAAEPKFFQFIRDVKISFCLAPQTNFCVNNSFVKILKPARDGGGFGRTVAFREYIYISHPIEIVFDTLYPEAPEYLKKYLHNINYFGKKGCFFQFLEYLDNPSEANVNIFNSRNITVGILQEYDDIDINAQFDNVNNYSNTGAKRKKEVYVLPLKKTSTSKSYANYEINRLP